MSSLQKVQLDLRGTLIFLIIVAIFMSLAEVAEAISIKHYTDDQVGFSIDYPDIASWTIRKPSELKPPGIIGFINSESKATIVVGFLKLPNVVPDLSETGVLQAAVDDIFGSYQKRNTNAKLISSGILINRQKLKGVEVVYTDVILGEAWKGKLVAFFKGNKRYDVTALATKDQFQQADTEFFSVVLKSFAIGIREPKINVSSKSKVSCSIFKDVAWRRVEDYKVEGNINATPPLKVEFQYTVGKDGTLHCTGWKNLSDQKSILTAMGSIIDLEGNDIISFTDVPVLLRLDQKTTNLDEKVYFEFCLENRWRVQMFKQGSGYSTKIYRGR